MRTCNQPSHGATFRYLPRCEVHQTVSTLIHALKTIQMVRSFGLLELLLNFNDVLLAFCALPIPNTPEVNRIIAFMRGAYTPCIYIPTFLRQSPHADLPLQTLVVSRSLPGSCGVLRDWQNCLDYPEVQPAWMAGNLSAMMDILPLEEKPQLYTLMLQCRERGLELLHQAVNEQMKLTSVPKLSLLLQIMLLYREGCIRDQPQGIEAYAVVQQYVEKAYIDANTAINVLVIAMFNDVEAACKRLQRTILDFERWLAQRMKPFATYAESYLPPASAQVATNLHQSLATADHVIHGAILRLRRCLDLRERMDPLTMHPPENYTAGDMGWAWMASTGLHDMGLLVNQYCGLMETRHGIEHSEALWNHDVRTATILTTLFTMRKLVHEGSCNGVDLREAHLIIPTLEEVLKRALRYSTEEQRLRSREPLMWMYFWGAWHGQNIQYQRRRGVFGDRPPAASTWTVGFDATWFNKKLNAQAHALRLTRWYDARELLKQFAFSELIRPHPVQWYEKTVTVFGSSGSADSCLLASLEHSGHLEGQSCSGKQLEVAVTALSHTVGPEKNDSR